MLRCWTYFHINLINMSACQLFNIITTLTFQHLCFYAKSHLLLLTTLSKQGEMLNVKAECWILQHVGILKCWNDEHFIGGEKTGVSRVLGFSFACGFYAARKVQLSLAQDTKRLSISTFQPFNTSTFDDMMKMSKCSNVEMYFSRRAERCKRRTRI